MIKFAISEAARQAVQSPSVALERGAYRMRAPSLRYPEPRQPKKIRRPSQANTWMATLVVLCALASVSCFAAAYYLFTTRWESEAPDFIRLPRTDERIQVLHNDTSAFLDPVYPDGRYLSYLPHSGFHNQRIAFENALILSRMLNRTLLAPPVRLGKKPLRYVRYDHLKRFVALSDKHGLYHCSKTPVDIIPAECIDYHDYTLLPWDWLVDLSDLRSRQQIVPRWNMSDYWLRDGLNVTEADVLLLRDDSSYDFRFVDTLDTDTPLKHKFRETIYIPNLVRSEKRLIQIGTLFGSSRLRLRKPANLKLRKAIRESMVFGNHYLSRAAELVADALGGSFIGAHIRVGDGGFKQDEEQNVHLIWWKLIRQVLQFSQEETLDLERQFFKTAARRDPPVLTNDSEPLREPFPPIWTGEWTRLACRGPKYATAALERLNVPLFISTDAASPATNTALAVFMETFPCTFFLSDFPAEQSGVNALQSGLDGLMLSKFLSPFLDAMIVSKARAVVGTEGSTFSRFVQDVLWRKHYGLDIVQRG